jgi:hypothetical protein
MHKKPVLIFKSRMPELSSVMQNLRWWELERLPYLLPTLTADFDSEGHNLRRWVSRKD